MSAFSPLLPHAFGQTTYAAASPANTLSGSADVGRCAPCQGGYNVQNLGGPGKGTLTIHNITVETAGLYTVKIIYDNGNSSDLPAAISVNGGARQTVHFPSTGSWTNMSNVSLNLPLNVGVNAIKFATVNGNWVAEICSVSVSAVNSAPTPAPIPIPTPTPTPTATPNAVSLTVFGNVGKGGDDTGVFQNALNSTSTAGETLEVPAGNYNVGPLTIPSGTKLLMAPGATVTATASGFAGCCSRLLDINNDSNVTITGTPGQSIFRMLKANYQDGSEYRHCLGIENSSNVTIDGIACNDSGGDGVYIAGTSSNIALKNSTFNNNSRNAISVIAVSGLLVDNCKLTNTVGNPNVGSAPDGPWDGIDFEPNSPSDRLQNITIQNTLISGNGLPCPSGCAGHGGNGITFATGRLNANSGTVGLTINNVTSTGNLGSGFFFANDPTLPMSTTMPPGTVLLENSSSINDGQWGIVGYFWDYFPNGITFKAQNVTITNPQQGYGAASDNAAVAMAGGGGDSFQAGNWTMTGLNITYNGKYYFNIGPAQTGGVRNISVGNFGRLSGQTGSTLGQFLGMGANSVSVP